MKAALVLMLLPILAHADEPSYKVPRSATAHKESCAIMEMVKRDGKAWATESQTQELNVQNWRDDTSNLVLSTGENFVRHIRTTEQHSDGTVLSRVQEKEEWVKDKEWQKKATTVQQTILSMPGQAYRVIEVADGVSESFSLRTYGDGPDQVTERLSVNPSRYSSAGRQVGSRIEVCRAHIFSAPAELL